MSFLLREIEHVDRHAAAVLKEAGLLTDSAILTLTREDLRDLFPETKDFSLRRTLYDKIHKQPTVEQILKKVKGFISHDSLRAALTNNGVLVDYFQLLKDMKIQMNGQMSFINAHIDFLEEFSKDQPNCRQTDHSPEGGELYSDPSASATGDPVVPLGDQRGGSTQRPRGFGASNVGGQMNHPAGLTGDCQQGPPGSGPSYASDQRRPHGGLTSGYSPGTEEFYSGQSASATSDTVGPLGDQSDGFSKRPRGSGASSGGGQKKHPDVPFSRYSPGPAAKLLYKMVVGGKTFNHHLTLMENVKKQVSNWIRLCDVKQDYELTFVFCPISSRIGADVEAAMTDIKDDKPIILVLMHHTREVKAVTSMRTWSDDANVVLRVNVFYHETTGLLKCQENDAAVTQIKKKLLPNYSQGGNDTGRNAQSVGAEVKSKNWYNPFS